MSRWLLLSILGMILGGGSVEAATVAYWQFDADGVADFTKASVGGPLYNLTAANGASSQSALRAVNPVVQPDTTISFLGDPAANSGSVLSSAETSRYLFATGGDAALNVAGSNQWTVEGYFNLQVLPSSSLDVIFSTRVGSTAGEGLLFDVRDVGGNTRLSLFVDDGPTGSTLSTSQNLALNSWYHVALTYDGTAGNGLFQMFLDGQSLGTLALPVGVNRTIIDMNDLGRLELMGRSSFASNNSFGGRMDEWRISNTLLLPSQFLNAPLQTAVVPEPSTWLLTACGMMGLFLVCRKNKRVQLNGSRCQRF